MAAPAYLGPRHRAGCFSGLAPNLASNPLIAGAKHGMNSLFGFEGGDLSAENQRGFVCGSSSWCALLQITLLLGGRGLDSSSSRHILLFISLIARGLLPCYLTAVCPFKWL